MTYLGYPLNLASPNFFPVRDFLNFKYFETSMSGTCINSAA